MRRAAGQDDGFTLVELTVAMLLLALVGATLTMTIGRTGRPSNPRDIARSIAVEARSAWRTAAASGREAVLTVDLTKRQVSVDDQPAKVSVPERLPLSMTAAEKLVADGKVGKIVFFPDGSSTGGDITVGSPASGRYKVRVFWLTGAITTQRLP